MTREQKIAEANRLHAEGLTDREIGDRLGADKSAVWKWRNPEEAREMARRSNAKRNAAKRAWENDPANRGRCTRCGGLRGKGQRSDGLCWQCRCDLSAERRGRMVELRRQGLDNAQIAAKLDLLPENVANELHRARVVNGMDVPPSPYWERGKLAA